MKKKLLNSLRVLLVAAGLCVGGSAWAQTNYTNGSTVAAGDDYFLYNIGAGKFLDNGSDYNTRATVDNAGQVLTLAAIDADNGIYTVYTGLKANDGTGQGNYFTGAWMDSGEAVNLTFEEVITNPTGYTGKVYKIKNGENYSVYNTANGMWHADAYKSNAKNTAIDLIALSGTNNDYWLLIPKSVRQAAGDYTYLMKEASFNWTSSTVWNNTNATLFQGQDVNVLNEAYNTTFNVYQTINVPTPGKYRVKVKGFYRNGNNYESTDEVNSCLYATGLTTKTTNLPLIITGTSTEALYSTEDWMSDVKKGDVYVPNSTNGASAHIAQGKYATTTVDVDVVNTLTLGVKCENNVTNSWTIFDEFEIEYLGELTYDKSITYDFKSFVGSGEKSAKFTASTSSVTGYTTVYTPNEFTDELGGKFAFQYNSTGSSEWTLRNTDADKGLCFYNTSKDEHFSIAGLKAGDKVVVNVSSGQVLFSTGPANCYGPYKASPDFNVLTDDNTQPLAWGELQDGSEYFIKSDGVLNLQAKKTWAVISSISIYTNAEETVTAPSISSEATDGGRNVTITSGTSNLLAGRTTYYTTDGSTPTSSSTKYTGSFKLTETATVKAITISNSSAATASSVAELEVNMETVDNPVLEVTGASNNSRIVTITCSTEGATIYYSETEKTNDEEGWSTYSTPVTTASATLWAYAKKGSVKSGVASIATGSGTTINLAAPTIAHTGANQYTISNDQSGILGTPTATIHYQIDGGSEQTSTNSSVNVPITADGTIKYWLTATGYGATDEANANVYATVSLATVTTIDLCTATNNSWASRGDAIDGLSGFYKYISAENATTPIVADGVFAATFSNGTDGGTTWRMQQKNGGTKNQNSAESIAILNAKKDQVVRVMSNIAPTVNANVTVLEGNTYPGTYSFTVNADGNAVLNTPKNSVITKIYVEQDHTDVTLGTNGYATFASAYPLDLANLPTGLTAYKAAVSGTTVTFTALNQTVPANTGILLQGEASGEYAIPVASSGTTVEDNAFLVNKNGSTFTADDNYYYFGLMKNTLTFGQFAPATVAIPANKAYLKVLKSSIDESPSRALTIIFSDEITGIETVQGSRFNAQGSEFFDLQGRRVSQPAKGLYIVNGKKVIIK